MQALIEQTRPYRPHEEPPNVTAAVLWSTVPGQRHPGLRITIADHLPANTLGELRLWQREIRLSERLFPSPSALSRIRGALQRPPEVRPGWEWELLIEDNISCRLVLACLFTAWYAYPQIVSKAARCGAEEVALNLHGRKDPVWSNLFNPYHALTVAFAPVNAWCKTFNTRWQTPYYTEFWRRLLSLLVNQQQLDAQTRSYLEMDEGAPVPRGRALRDAIWNVRHTPSPSEYQRYGPQGYAQFAWDKYADFLAGESHVPRVLVESKLTGAFAQLERGEDLALLTSELIAHDKRLCDLRRSVATDRNGYGLASEQEVGLYLAEPKMLVPSMGKGDRYWGGGRGGARE